MSVFVDIGHAIKMQLCGADTVAFSFEKLPNSELLFHKRISLNMPSERWYFPKKIPCFRGLLWLLPRLEFVVRFSTFQSVIIHALLRSHHDHLTSSIDQYIAIQTASSTQMHFFVLH